MCHGRSRPSEQRSCPLVGRFVVWQAAAEVLGMTAAAAGVAGSVGTAAGLKA
jgi:hypothetical protein